MRALIITKYFILTLSGLFYKPYRMFQGFIKLSFCLSIGYLGLISLTHAVTQNPICALIMDQEQQNKNQVGPREIRAEFDDEGVYVYQAYNDQIANEALALGHFGPSFRLSRLTWIKPSFGWMLHRSQYGSMPNQTRILKIKISHDGFKAILGNAVSAAFEAITYESQRAWKRALQRSSTRYQWDPDRNVNDRRTGRRAIQIGITGETARKFSEEWILDIQDVTALAHEIKAKLDGGEDPDPIAPVLRLYPLDNELRRSLSMEVSEEP